MSLQLFSTKPTFDFMGKRWWGFAVSFALTLAAVGMLWTKGLNLGIDFTGGILMEVHSEQPIELGELRALLNSQNFGEVSLQTIGANADNRDIMLRIQSSKDEDQAKTVALVKQLLTTKLGEALDYRKIEYVGPTVGQELVQAGVISVLLSFAAIMIYVWFRFEWQYGVGAMLALFHDSIMIVGFFAITRFEFGLTAVAAILTIVGYSINDSVVIYDRIRENMRRYKKMPIEELLNISLNETLSRTILTASTTLLAATALTVFGGEVIRGFSAAMMFGVIVGTYSSIYISAPTLLYLNLRSISDAMSQAEAKEEKKKARRASFEERQKQPYAGKSMFKS